MTSSSRPPSPTLGRSDSPAGGMGYFSLPFERFRREDVYSDWTSAFTLLGAFRGVPVTPKC
jgi:hypothetical protein